MQIIFKSGLLLIAFAHGAHAQDEVSVVTDEVVVTARRVPEKLQDTIQSTTVISAKDIAESQALDVPTLLRKEAGIEITQQGGLGKQSSTFTRGTNSTQTLVLLDGVRVGSATAGFTALDQITLDQIERIEIVRGNVSSIYGSEAIGGVIQIFTRQGSGKPAVSAAVGVGPDNLRRYSANFGGSTGDSRFNLGASHVETDGFSAIRPQFIPAPFVTAPGDIDRDGYRNNTFTAKASHRLTPGNELGFSAFHSEGKVDFDGTFQNSSKQDLSSVSIFSDNRFTENWQSKLTLALGIDNLRSFLDAADAGRVRTDNTQIIWQNQVQLWETSQFTGGYERLEQKVSSDTVYSRTNRQVHSGFAGYRGDFGAHSLQANVRVDAYSDFGTQPTGLLGYGYAFAPRWRINASAGTAFRAPTFNDLYAPFFGNPNVRPEQARSAELGLQYRDGQNLARVSYFITRVTDLITFQPAPPFTSANIGKAEIQGVEFSYSGRILNTDLKASFTLQDPRDKTNNIRLLRRAEHFGSLSAQKTLGALQVGGELRASGKRDDVDITQFTRTRVGGYTVVNLTARFNLTRAVSLAARVENLFDKDYELVQGYNIQRRALFFTLAYQPR
ncbi:MAG: TonB-dependent receptor domain-containing protein [Burkholderiales bacterium]